MTDFRNASNPRPFTQLGMEGDESPLTGPEREALRVLTREAVRFAGLTEVIDSARAAMARAQHAERAAEGRQT